MLFPDRSWRALAVRILHENSQPLLSRLRNYKTFRTKAWPLDRIWLV